MTHDLAAKDFTGQVDNGEFKGYQYQFSVIIPTYNRPQQLRACLTSITHLVYQVDRFEVIVVDDGSPMLLDDAVQPFRDHLNIRLIRIVNSGPGAARNEGTSVACGRFLAFTDDDCYPSPYWLQKLDARFEQTPDRMIGGPIINCLTRNHYSTTSQIIVELAYAFYNKNPHAARFFASNNMAISTELFQKVGGFSTAFKIASEDRELCDRWLNLGYTMTYAPEVVIFHEHSLKFRSFCKQHFNYGRGAFQYQQLRIKRDSGRMRNDMKFHTQLPNLLREPMSKLSSGQAATVAMLLVLWQFLNAAGFFYEKYRNFKSMLRKL